MLAPICLFTYNRLNETKQTIAALQQNFLAKESDLFIYSDGAKNEEGSLKVNEVRTFIKSISGFKSITIFEAEKNMGLANSIIGGVSQIIEKYGKIIVLEDDLITSPNFLDFMNQALVFYQKNNKIISISGHTLDFQIPSEYKPDMYFFGRAGSWGWATWKSRWSLIDWEVKDWNTFKKSKKLIKDFKLNGNDLYSMLKDYKENKNDSWAIRFCYNQFKQKTFTVYPSVSKVNNIGFTEDGTNCKGYNKYEIKFQPKNKLTFHFSKNISINIKIQKQIRKHFGFYSRVKSKVLTFYFKIFKI